MALPPPTRRYRPARRPAFAGHPRTPFASAASARLVSENVPESGPGAEPALDAALLARALVALNRHGDLLRALGEMFESAGHQLYLVGGSVRDALLGRLSPDLDFTTGARPDAVQRIVRPWADALWDTGIEFGTVGAARA